MMVRADRAQRPEGEHEGVSGKRAPLGRKVEDDGWHIATWDKGLSVWYPEDDLAYYVMDINGIDPECDITLATRLLGRGDGGTLDCGNGISIVDDVISTGSTLQGMRLIIEKAGGAVTATTAVFTEGERAKWKDIIALGHLPIFTSDSK